jgi:hypothetical protein
MVQHSPFTGKEDPNLHLQAFIQLCQTFNMDGVTHDQLRARLFPFSLLEKDLQWFHSQPAETVQKWNTLMKAFMKEYYSPGKTQSLRNKIATFVQYPTETISKAFECFNEYTQAVLYHKFPKEDLVQKFYQGLTMASRTIIDASAGGSIIELTPTEAFTLFKKVADNDTWASSGHLHPVQPTGNVKGVLQVEKENILTHEEIGKDGDRKERGSRLEGCRSKIHMRRMQRVWPCTQRLSGGSQSARLHEEGRIAELPLRAR